MNTCKECNYWAPEAPLAKERDNMGECNKLSYPETEIKTDYVLPVLNGQELEKMKHTEILTAANFGCNQFAQA